ncbi:hypothetical protein E8D34_18135 [Nocardioides sp. GY 10113]|uniref:hypothetical protein n=1 Tax=Nocardioides sp. GY 10113 TaxID=2569761 RepID=UPI0010A7677D|nr:hypothetical protein [Nocardioides sp. GY 10113]TIC81313.1 hypothetical protein E8D34_18135 [Nocardioides sp. GY 10113]
MSPLGPPPDRPPQRIDENRRRYLDDISTRIRAGEREAMLRNVGIQALWILVIVAGAGVPLSEAVGAPAWVAPTLGFVVVVAAGVERVFARTTTAAAAQEALRRALAREQRAYDARVGVYADGSAFDRLVDRCERLIADYDRTMVQYAGSLARRSE